MEKIDVNEFRTRWKALCAPRNAEIGLNQIQITTKNLTTTATQLVLFIYGKDCSVHSKLDVADFLMPDQKIKDRIIAPLVSYLEQQEDNKK